MMKNFMTEEKKEEYYNRRGHGISWASANRFSYISGFTIDNLDKKQVHEATDDYEKMFVIIREMLESNESLCLDEEEERLDICQKISDVIKRKFDISFKVY